MVQQKGGEMPRPHAVMVPYPAQGHVIPFMKLARVLASDQYGFDVTFVNTDFIHARIAKAVAAENGFCVENGSGSRIRLVSVPDGLGVEEDRTDHGRNTKAINEAMPAALEELIRRLKSEGREATCMFADITLAWAVEVGERVGVSTGVFCPASVALHASLVGVPWLMEEGYIGTNGLPLKQDSFKLAPGMPSMNASNFTWNYIGSPEAQRIVFRHVVDNNYHLKRAAFSICNSFSDIEHPALSYLPHVRPIGPLLHVGAPSPAHFWARDLSCKSWLDNQPDRSVVYVAFGSLTVFGMAQLRELALGLELTSRPFLWVVRPDVTGGLQGTEDAEAEAFLDEFVERVRGRGRVVKWAPQEEVLAHPAVACFVSHCGWNSTMEAVYNGVPFLCWPYFADQFLNRDYICNEWKIGKRLEADSTGLLTKEEFGEKLDELLADERLTERVVEIQDKAVRNVKRGGVSWNNLNHLVQELKEGSYSTSPP